MLRLEKTEELSTEHTYSVFVRPLASLGVREMNVGGEKRISKWDLKDATLLPGTLHNNVGHAKADTEKNAVRESSDVYMHWDGDSHYSTKMSPGLDEWRQQKLDCFPNRGWVRSYRSRSRSRSRDPRHGVKRESGSDDGSTMDRHCEDLASGRSKKGDHCSSFHQDNKEFEDRRNHEGGVLASLEHRHSNVVTSNYLRSEDTREQPQRIGRSNDKYAHIRAASDGIRVGSADADFIERESIRNTSSTFKHNRNYDYGRIKDIPCKFFAAGNCRNGNLCWFAHLCQKDGTSGNKSHDDWSQQNNNTATMDHLREGLNWSDAAVLDVAKLPIAGDGRHWNVTLPDQKAMTWSTDDRREPNLNYDYRSWVPRMNSDQAVETSDNLYLQLRPEGTGAGIDLSESRIPENWPRDVEISPAGNYGYPSSDHISKEETLGVTHLSQHQLLDGPASLPFQQDLTRESSTNHHLVAATQSLISPNCFQSVPSLGKDAANGLFSKDMKATPDGAVSQYDMNFSASVLPRHSLGQYGQSSSAANTRPQVFNSVVRDDPPSMPQDPRTEFITAMKSQQLSKGGSDKLDLQLEMQTSPHLVSEEQLSQHTNLSASLAQLFGNGKQISELCAALNDSNTKECIPSSLSTYESSLVPPAVPSFLLNPSVGLQKQSGPPTNGTELIKPAMRDLPQCGVALNFNEENGTADKKPDVWPLNLTAGEAGDGDWKGGHSKSELGNKRNELNKPELIVNCKVPENVKMVAEESNKGNDSDHVERIDDSDDKADRSKKNSDGKVNRAFKFALAEFVKELLKPKWKDGQITKDAHKTIVKKVVDKVIDSIQGVHIPQSQDKIDNYLSFSKSKLSKLVQAYVEKYKERS